MKILKWIDQYVDSFEKRIFLFIIFITIYWLWQNIWQLALFFKMFQIADYTSLLGFQSTLRQYENSVFVRLILYFISNQNRNLFSFVSCIKLIDIFGIFGMILMVKEYKNVLFIHGIKYVWSIFWIIKGLNSSSLNIVIYSLKWLSLGCLLCVFAICILLLYKVVSYIIKT